MVHWCIEKCGIADIGTLFGNMLNAFPKIEEFFLEILKEYTFQIGCTHLNLVLFSYLKTQMKYI